MCYCDQLIYLGSRDKHNAQSRDLSVPPPHTHTHPALFKPWLHLIFPPSRKSAQLTKQVSDLVNMRVTKGPTFKALVKKRKQKERLERQQRARAAKGTPKHRNPHSSKSPDVKVKDLIEEIKRKRHSLDGPKAWQYEYFVCNLPVT